MRYKVVSDHLPQDLHGKLHRGDHGHHQIATLLHDHISNNHEFDHTDGHEDLDKAKRSAIWNAGHTNEEGVRATPIVAHMDEKGISAYSWRPEHKADWVTHDVMRPFDPNRHKVGVLQFFAEIDKYDQETHRVPDVSKSHVDKIVEDEQKNGDHESDSSFHKSVCRKAFGCDNNDNHPLGTHYLEDHFCENHNTYHGDSDHKDEKLRSGAFHATRHNRAHTDWDQHHENISAGAEKDPKGDIHRGMSFHLPDKVHKAVHGHGHVEHVPTSREYARYEHNSTTPKKKIAEHLINHASGKNMGMHWSTDQATSEAFSQENSHPLKVGDEPREGTQVIFHAKMPHKDHIEKDGYELAKHGVFHHHHDYNEKEVPLKQNAPVHITGVSWKHPSDDQWQHFGMHRENPSKNKDLKDHGLKTQHEAKLASQLIQKHATMVAIHPPAGMLDHLLPDRNPEDSSRLHLTLCCVDDEHDPGHLAELPDVVRMWAEKLDPIDLNVSGVGTFVNDDKHVLWASVDHPDLHRLHESLSIYLERHGFKVKQDSGFTPHITLGYGNTHYRFLPKLHEKVPFTAHDVLVHIGDKENGQREVHQVPLGRKDEGS